MTTPSRHAVALARLVSMYPHTELDEFGMDSYLEVMELYPPEVSEFAREAWSLEGKTFFPSQPEWHKFLRSCHDQATGRRLPPQRPRGVPVRGTVVTGLLARPVPLDTHGQPFALPSELLARTTGD